MNHAPSQEPPILLAEQADAIARAYPPTDAAMPGADRAAVVEAILAERERPGGATWEEIHAAAAEVRRMRVRHPSWLRTWARVGEYRPIVEALRRRLSLPAGPEPRDFLAAERDNAEAVAAEAAATAAALAGVSDAELELARQEIALEHPEPVRTALLRQNPRRGRIARLIVDRLAPAPGRTPTPAGRSRVLPEGRGGLRSGEPRDSSVHTVANVGQSSSS